MLRKRVAVIVGRAEADGDARQSGDRLDHADELRGAEYAAELAIAGGKIRDAHGGPLPVGEHRRHHRGVAQVFRLEIGHVVEDDVGETLLLVTREQPAEDRVTVEAGIAPPHQARGRIDERSRAPVADDGKI